MMTDVGLYSEGLNIARALTKKKKRRRKKVYFRETSDMAEARKPAGVYCVRARLLVLQTEITGDHDPALAQQEFICVVATVVSTRRYHAVYRLKIIRK